MSITWQCLVHLVVRHRCDKYKASIAFPLGVITYITAHRPTEITVSYIQVCVDALTHPLVVIPMTTILSYDISQSS